MPRSIRNTHAAFWTSLAILAATATLLAFLGCGSDDDKNPVTPGGGGTTTTSFTGTLAGGTVSGKIGITISSASLARGLHGAAATVVAATGSIELVGGGTIALTGSYDTVLDTLYLAGGGYIIRGIYEDSVTPHTFTGSWVGPGDSGGWGCVQGGTSAVKVFCGTYDAVSDDYGTLNMVVSADTVVTGIAQPVSGEASFFEGTLSRDETSAGYKTFTIWASDDEGWAMTGTGELAVATNLVTGTYETTQGGQPLDSGTWEAALKQ